MGLSNSTYEGTFIEMWPWNSRENYDDGIMRVKTKIDRNDCVFYLHSDNANYEKIYNTLKKNNVYRFVVNSFKHPSSNSVDLLDIKPPLHYEATIKITKLLDLKIQYDNGYDSHQVMHECVGDGGYTPIYELGDVDKVSEFSKSRQLKLIIGNEHINNIQLGGIYNIKFKKHHWANLYSIVEHEKVNVENLNINHEEKVKLL